MKTSHKLMTVFAALASSFLAAPAFAQDTVVESYGRRQFLAPRKAFEVTLAPVFSQPFGDVAPNLPVRDLANAGVGGQLGLGYRVHPRWMVGVTGQYVEFLNTNDRALRDVSSRVDGRDPNTPVDGRSRGLGGTIDVTYHGRPYGSVDPWVLMGTGWRGLWEVRDGSGNNAFRHGFQLARVALGADFRISRDVAIAPFVGGDVNLFLWQAPENGSTTAISDPRANVWLQAGLQGRFDIGGQREDRYGERRVTASR